MSINKNTSLEELAVQVSTALADAGIVATLSGGAAVSIYSDNAYESADLDFVTSEGHKMLSSVIGVLGFTRYKGSRLFEHPDCDWLVEFPPGPLGFGDTIVDAMDIPLLGTKYGQLRIITPTLSILDRLAAYWYHGDNQTWDQAIEVAKRQNIDWEYVYTWARSERQSKEEIDKLKSLSEDAS
jgi:hypothetical protein